MYMYMYMYSALNEFLQCKFTGYHINTALKNCRKITVLVLPV